MINYIDLGVHLFARNRNLLNHIAEGKISLGGYRNNKIYGTLTCASGKRMNAENRVFFADEQEAINVGYRPCGHCMSRQYKLWKQENGTV